MPTILQDGSTRYLTGPGGLPIEQVDGSGSTEYYVQDQLGSTRGLLDASGTVTGTYTFTPYGEVKGHWGVGTPFGYAGQYTDSESGLQYLRARYYDPSTAQFLTLDPLVSATLEPYGYAGGNPMNAIDPLDAWGVRPPWCVPSGPFASAIGNALGQAGNAGGNAIGKVTRATAHGALDLIAFVPYADYYLAYRTLSTVPLGPWTCAVATYQNWGLSVDIGLDRFKRSTLGNGEKPNDEGKHIYILPVHWGPKAWGPGWWEWNSNRIDLWPYTSYPWQSGFGRPKG